MEQIKRPFTVQECIKQTKIVIENKKFKIMTISIQIQQPTLLRPEKTSTSKIIESSLTSDSTQVLRRQVRFRDTVSVRLIKHIDDMSNKQVFDAWYGNKDFKKIKKVLLQMVRLLMMTHGDNTMIDKEEHCSRGLEYRTREGAAARRVNKWNALDAVLEEQIRQRVLGIRNEKLLCQIYVAENCHSRLNALKLGIEDEKAAMAIYYSEQE